MKILSFISLLLIGFLFTNCKEEKKGPSESELKAFLISKEGTFGWVTKSDSISLDFFQDGRLHIQGPDGEATMWEGKWSLQGDKLSMERPDMGKNITVTVKINGEELMLDQTVYTRYSPQ